MNHFAVLYRWLNILCFSVTCINGLPGFIICYERAWTGQKMVFVSTNVRIPRSSQQTGGYMLLILGWSFFKGTNKLHLLCFNFFWNDFCRLVEFPDSHYKIVFETSHVYYWFSLTTTQPCWFSYTKEWNPSWCPTLNFVLIQLFFFSCFWNIKRERKEIGKRN